MSNLTTEFYKLSNEEKLDFLEDILGTLEVKIVVKGGIAEVEDSPFYVDVTIDDRDKNDL